MKQQSLGQTGLTVSALGYGVMGLRECDFSHAEKLLNAALDLGINLIDSSPCYGEAEAYVGRAISHRRAEFVLATKCGCHVDGKGMFLEGQDHVFTGEQVRKNVEGSLRLLKTDAIDLLQLHGIMPESIQPGHREALLRTLEEMKQQGKVKHIGFSCRNGIPGELLYPDRYCVAAVNAFLPWEQMEALQLVYSMFLPDNEALIQQAWEAGRGVICRGVVRRYHSDYENVFERAGLQRSLETGETMMELQIRYALSTEGISSSIIGTSNLEHLKENIRMADKGALSQGRMNTIRERIASVLRSNDHKKRQQT